MFDGSETGQKCLHLKLSRWTKKLLLHIKITVIIRNTTDSSTIINIILIQRCVAKDDCKFARIQI